jgi:hypothetical protein
MWPDLCKLRLRLIPSPTDMCTMPVTPRLSTPTRMNLPHRSTTRQVKPRPEIRSTVKTIAWQSTTHREG